MLAPGAHHVSLTASVDAAGAAQPGRRARADVGGVRRRAPAPGRASTRAAQPLPAGVAFTAIYSRRDGIVDWRACVDPLATPVEVTASHLGMALDPRVIDHVRSAPCSRQARSAQLLEVDRGETRSFCEAVLGGDLADRAAARAHHQRVGRAAAGAVAHAAHQVAVGDAGGDEEAVVAGDQVVGGEHEVGVEVVAGVERLLPLRRRPGATAGPGSRRPCTSSRRRR